ncbi:MAG: DUF3330 domain-containing protein [Betaproteobacteria bacterium]|nr:MAG: hypothetical protein AMJ67_16000 [Betaproteobacteria bacterium SG8_41]UCF75002.1 MAG: DUF3330 domain-containing protein [Betaproteobacteria bacterium]
MSETKPETKQVPCEICLKEIPASEAKTAEAVDYVAHFCGLDCYNQWKAKQEADETSKAGART